MEIRMLHPYPIRYLEGKELNFYQLLPLKDSFYFR